MSPAIDSLDKGLSVREATMLGRTENRLSKHERTPGKRRRRGSVVPWVIAGLVLVAGAVGSYVMVQAQKQRAAELAQVRAEVEAANQRAATAAHHIDNLETDLSLVRTEYEQAKARAEEAERKAAEVEDLAKNLEQLAKGKGKVVRQAEGRLTLELVDKVLFRSGEATLTRRGKAVLRQVGEALNRYPNKQIWVQGHTDAVPLSQKNRKFATNWELSAARALTVVHYLQDEVKVHPRRLAAVAFGQHRPVSRVKAKNRRIEIVLLPDDIAVDASKVR